MMHDDTPLSSRLNIWNVPTKKYIIKYCQKGVNKTTLNLATECVLWLMKYCHRLRGEIKANKRKKLYISTAKKCDLSHNWKGK